MCRLRIKTFTLRKKIIVADSTTKVMCALPLSPPLSLSEIIHYTKGVSSHQKGREGMYLVVPAV